MWNINGNSVVDNPRTKKKLASLVNNTLLTPNGKGARATLVSIAKIPDIHKKLMVSSECLHVIPKYYMGCLNGFTL